MVSDARDELIGSDVVCNPGQFLQGSFLTWVAPQRFESNKSEFDP